MDLSSRIRLIASDDNSLIEKPKVPTWIYAGGKYHILRTKTTYSVSGARVIGKYDITLCTGRQIGGAWGSKRVTEMPPHGVVCKSCIARENKGQ